VARKGGYAKTQTKEFYENQRGVMTRYVAAADVVIAPALVRGTTAPTLTREEMVQAMPPGSVIVDLAADQGGNCAATEAGTTVVKHGVTIAGPLNLPATMPRHASEMYARTITNFLSYLFRDGKMHIDLEDEIVRATLLGEVVNHEHCIGVLATAALAVIYLVFVPAAAPTFYAMTATCLVFGVLLVIPIGAADMPVLIFAAEFLCGTRRRGNGLPLMLFGDAKDSLTNLLAALKP